MRYKYDVSLIYIIDINVNKINIWIADMDSSNGPIEMPDIEYSQLDHPPALD